MSAALAAEINWTRAVSMVVHGATVTVGSAEKMSSEYSSLHHFLDIVISHIK